jgi:HlyD family secretion protein
MMKKKIFRWTLVILICAATIILIWRYTQPDPVQVIITAVERGTVEKIVANTRAGTVKACRRAKLSPSIGGQIAKLPVQEGDKVRAGKLLLELWNDDLIAQGALAESEAVTSKARAEAACLKAEVAQRDANRLVKLRKTGAASEEQTDQAVTRAKAQKADCAAAIATVGTSQARVGVAKANLARTRLTAPFDGIIAAINGELNEYVTPSPVGIATPPAIDIIDVSCFYVTAPIDEVDAAAIEAGLPARVTLDAFDNRQFAGKVRRVAAYVLDREKQARTVDVEVEFIRPEDNQRLLAGYSADVEIILDVRPEIIRIPTQAVLDGKHVFVYLADEKLIRTRKIEVGLSNWEYTQVISGLNPGEMVVTSVDRAGIKEGAHALAAEEKP